MENYMKMKKYFTLAALLTSSLAGAIDLGDLENKYYAGLNFGGEYSGKLSTRPNILIGYHYEKSSKLELEINANFHSLTDVTLVLLGNYRYYPDLNIDPVTLYVSGGLGTGFRTGGGASTTSPSEGEKVTPSDDDEVIQQEEPNTESAAYAGEGAAAGPSMVDNVLGYFHYKLKVGVDYEFTPQIISAVGINLGGSFHGLIKTQRVGTGIELGIRYNF